MEKIHETVYIYHHLGMGDHILCNAIVRIAALVHDDIVLFAKPNNIKNVQYMYRDLKNLSCVAYLDKDIQAFIRRTPQNKYLIVGITPQWFAKMDAGGFETFDIGFYESVGISIEEKWNHFHFERDLDLEKHIFYDVLRITDDDEFIFVHDDLERDRHFKPEYIEGKKIVRVTDHLDIGLFDFLYTIQKAREVHVMNSSFSCLIDTMQLPTRYPDNLFLHSYAREDMGPNANHKLKLNWNVIK